MDSQPRNWAVGLGELAPMLRRIEALNALSPVRLRVEDGAQAVTAFVTLPFGVLISRTVGWADAPQGGAGSRVESVNRTCVLNELLPYLAGDVDTEPARRDEMWKGGLPPLRGWARLDSLADSVVREQVRIGAQAVKDLADQAADGQQVRQPAIEALLDSVVLTVSAEAPVRAEPDTAPIPLRSLSALTRMGFMPRESRVGVDVCRSWIRIAGVYGAAYAINAAARGHAGPRGLGLLPVLR